VKLSKQYPQWAQGWILIDDRDTPSLERAIGAQIFYSQKGAIERRAKCANGQQLSAVPVGDLDCSAVTVSITGRITVAPKPAARSF
jgi:hypothetical protein